MATQAELEAELAALKAEIAALKQQEPPPTDAYPLDTQHLDETEQQVLRLIGVGLNDRNAAEAAGMSRSYIRDRMQASLYFAKAYTEVKDRYDDWLQARVKFIMPEVWARIEKILADDPDILRAQDSGYARVVYQTQAKIVDKLLRINYAEETKVTHEHGLSEPLMQMAAQNAALVAQQLAQTEREIAKGTADKHLPEHQIIDLPVTAFAPVFDVQPRDEQGRFRCLECDAWVVDLLTHLQEAHALELQAYQIKHNLDPMVSYA